MHGRWEMVAKTDSPVQPRPRIVPVRTGLHDRTSQTVCDMGLDLDRGVRSTVWMDGWKQLQEFRDPPKTVPSYEDCPDRTAPGQ